MPISWAFSHKHRLVLAVARDRLSPRDVAEYFEAVSREGAASYRKLFDMTESVADATGADLRTLGAYVRDRADEGPVGPVAIVVRSEHGTLLAKLFDRAADAERPLRIFREAHHARAWLDSLDAPAADRSTALKAG